MIEKTTNIGLVKEDENEFYSVNTTNENLDKIDEAFGDKADKEAIKNYFSLRVLGTYSTSTYYVGFASLPLPAVVANGRSEVTLLISGTGNIGSPLCGTYLVQCGTRNKASMTVTELTPPGSDGDISFGFWQTEDRIIFGMKRVSYNYHTNIAMVSEDVNGEGFSKYEIAELYNGIAKPPGWTDAGKRVLLTIEGTAAAATKLATPRTIDGVKFDGTANATHFGICPTAAETAAKTVSISNFVLAAGAEVTVLFSNGNTAEKPTLNVTGTGAKQIYYKGAALTANTAEYIMGNSPVNMVYTGNVWHIVGDLMQQQLDELKSFIHYEENYWEEVVPVIENAGQLYVYRGADMIEMIGTGQLENGISKISCTAVHVPINSDDTGRYRVITHADGAQPKPTDTTFAVKPALGVNGTSLMVPFNDTDFIFDSNTTHSQVKQLLVNKWGSDLAIEVYREIKKIW